jgi:hypothetical protein
MNWWAFVLFSNIVGFVLEDLIMEKSKLRMWLLVCAFALEVHAAGGALDDWDQGDPFKMHYSQLPEPSGWL